MYGTTGNEAAVLECKHFFKNVFQILARSATVRVGLFPAREALPAHLAVKLPYQERPEPRLRQFLEALFSEWGMGPQRIKKEASADRSAELNKNMKLPRRAMAEKGGNGEAGESKKQRRVAQHDGRKQTPAIK